MEKFISTWTLVAELKDLAGNGTNVEVTEAAKAHLDSYRFPVESMVSLPNGTVLSRMNANDLMEGSSNEEVSLPTGFSDELSLMYYKFLEEGVTKAKQFN